MTRLLDAFPVPELTASSVIPQSPADTPRRGLACTTFGGAYLLFRFDLGQGFGAVKVTHPPYIRQ